MGVTRAKLRLLNPCFGQRGNYCNATQRVTKIVKNWTDFSHPVTRMVFFASSKGLGGIVGLHLIIDSIQRFRYNRNISRSLPLTKNNYDSN